MDNLLKPVNIGNLQLKGNIFLAPIAGYSDKIFRALCVEKGAFFTYTEMVSIEALVRNSEKTESIIERADNEVDYAVQLFGANPETMEKATLVVLKKYQPSCIDINAGCPMQKINKTGAGAALMKSPKLVYDLVFAARRACKQHYEETGKLVPVTIKFRSGWSKEKLNWQEVALSAIEAGANALTFHPRTREQCYEGKANRSLIAELVELAKPYSIPIFGSGDVFTVEDVKSMLVETSCDGVMLARGAMGNPFIFEQVNQFLTTGHYDYPSLKTRLTTGLNELYMMCKVHGEKVGCLQMRKRFSPYTKGEVNASQLRTQLIQASTIEEYENICFRAIENASKNT